MMNNVYYDVLFDKYLKFSVTLLEFLRKILKHIKITRFIVIRTKVYNNVIHLFFLPFTILFFLRKSKNISLETELFCSWLYTYNK